MTATRGFYAGIVTLVALCVAPLSAMADNLLGSIVGRDYSQQARAMDVLAYAYERPKDSNPSQAEIALDEDVSLSHRRVLTRILQNNAKKLWANLNLSKYPATYCDYYRCEPVYALDGRLIERRADSAAPLKPGNCIVGNKKVVA